MIIANLSTCTVYLAFRLKVIQLPAGLIISSLNCGLSMLLNNRYIICVLTLLVFASCRTTRTLYTKDASASKPVVKKTNTPVKREFLNGIEVTPGAVVASNHKTNPAGSKKQAVSESTNTVPSSADLHTSFNIEKASMLQLKYAVLTDALVEKLTNIPLLEVIDRWWGTKYCMGGSTDNCLDCSAFTQIIMRDVYQVSLPRTSQEQYMMAEKIELEDLREGDLVFFNTGGKTISHVGVYLLNNKFVHAATSGGVMISDLNEKYWQPKYRGAGRVIKN